MKVQEIIDKLSEIDKDCNLNSSDLLDLVKKSQLGEIADGKLRVCYTWEVYIDDMLDCDDDDWNEAFIKALRNKDGIALSDLIEPERIDDIEFDHADVIKNEQVIYTIE